jgi:diketogulonate reductase-like aldo/keto reductase
MDINYFKTLNNGVKIPVLGLGVFKAEDGAEAYNAVKWALETGYRHIDTASAYGNEESVGRAIKDSRVLREELFVTTKLGNGDQRAGSQYKAFKESLKRLDMDYVDLYLIHWPVKDKYIDSWKILEQIYRESSAKAIGVSNFNIHHLEDIFRICETAPAVNQSECHPYLTQDSLAGYCAEKGIAFEPWSPLGRGIVLDDPVLIEIAEKYGKDTAQVVIRWGLQKGFINIPKSTHKERIVSNSRVFDFSLTDDEEKSISALNKNRRTGSDPDNFSF